MCACTAPSSACSWASVWEVDMASFSDQVEQREEIDPDQVDEVPVERDDVYRRPELLRKVASVVAEPDPDEDADTHEDVDAVHAGHHEINREERARVLRQ